MIYIGPSYDRSPISVDVKLSCALSHCLYALHSMVSYFVYVCVLLKHFNTYVLVHMHTHVQFNFILFLIDPSIVKGNYKYRQFMICISKFE